MSRSVYSSGGVWSGELRADGTVLELWSSQQSPLSSCSPFANDVTGELALTNADPNRHSGADTNGSDNQCGPDIT